MISLYIVGEWLLRIIGIYALIQVGVIGWLWVIHDKPVISIKTRIHDIPGKINEGNRGRGISRDEQERQINIVLNPKPVPK